MREWTDRLSGNAIHAYNVHRQGFTAVCEQVDNMAERKTYSTDLTDEQWSLIEEFMPAPKKRGKKRTVDLREVVNAILYISRTSCQWRNLPHDFPAKSTVWDYFARFKKEGTLGRIVDALRRQVRSAAGRQPEPKTAAIDSQTVATSHQGADSEVDGGKNVKGRKRHIVVCSMGLPLAVLVTAANLNEGTQAPRVLGKLSEQTTSRLENVYADNKYHCTACWDWQARPEVNYHIVVVKRQGKAFKLLPRRWVVERTYAWMGYNRRLSKDYERTTSSSEAWCQISMIHLMVRRLSPSNDVPEFKYHRTAKISA
jgi:putative transposase